MSASSIAIWSLVGSVVAGVAAVLAAAVVLLERRDRQRRDRLEVAERERILNSKRDVLLSLRQSDRAGGTLGIIPPEPTSLLFDACELLVAEGQLRRTPEGGYVLASARTLFSEVLSGPFSNP